MNQTRHCRLCDNQITSLDIGSICKLTNKKPDFKKTCSNINLDEVFEHKLIQTNLDLHLILKKKNAAYLRIFIIAITGALLLLGNKLLTEVLLNHRYYWVYRTAIIGAGILTFTNANFSLHQFLNKLKTAQSKKKNIDEVLAEYEISYLSLFDYKDYIHGNQEIEITIEYKNWKKKRTTTTCIINAYE
jgi:hypothetical protein